MARGKKKSRRLAAWAAAILACALVANYLAHLPHHRRHRLRWGGYSATTQHPDLATLAPGASGAIARALGPRGLERVTQIISPGGRASTVSGGTHMPSGFAHGHLYGLAFDIAVSGPAQAVRDTRALRLQGIAAWYRSPDSPDGAAGSGPHIHCVWPGAPTHNPQNLEQITSFVDGYRGLADAGLPHREWIDPTLTPAEIARVAHVYRTVHPREPLRVIVPYDALHRGRSDALASAREGRRSAG